MSSESYSLDLAIYSWPQLWGRVSLQPLQIFESCIKGLERDG